jgi:hypothetical protein
MTLFVGRDERESMNSLADWVALIGALVVTGLAIFQIFLAVGLPLGAAAFGGANVVLSSKLRIASAISALLFFAALYVVTARAGLYGVVGRSWPVHLAIWVFAAVFALSALANGASQSRWERFLMLPLAIVLAACCVTLAIVA